MRDLLPGAFRVQFCWCPLRNHGVTSIISHSTFFEVVLELLMSGLSYDARRKDFRQRRRKPWVPEAGSCHVRNATVFSW